MPLCKAFAGLVAALVVIAPVFPASAQDAQSQAPPERVEVEPTAADSKIAERLQRILKSTGWFSAPIVPVHDGVVTLDGTTETAEHQTWAGQLAEKTEGAVAVVNRIEVESDVGTTFGRTGEEIARLYRQVVQTWPLVVPAIRILAFTWTRGAL